MTPRPRSSAVSLDMRLMPPRTLNDPVGCWFSCLTSVRAPTSASSEGWPESCVRLRWRPTTTRAASTSAKVGGCIASVDLKRSAASARLAVRLPITDNESRGGPPSRSCPKTTRLPRGRKGVLLVSTRPLSARPRLGFVLAALAAVCVVAAGAAPAAGQAPWPSTVAPGAKLSVVYEDGRFFEGPSWDPATAKLYFTAFEKGNEQVLRLDAPGKVTVWMDRTQGVNGTYLSRTGRLLAAQAFGHNVLSM